MGVRAPATITTSVGNISSSLCRFLLTVYRSRRKAQTSVRLKSKCGPSVNFLSCSPSWSEPRFSSCTRQAPLLRRNQSKNQDSPGSEQIYTAVIHAFEESTTKNRAALLAASALSLAVPAFAQRPEDRRPNEQRGEEKHEEHGPNAPRANHGAYAIPPGVAPHPPHLPSRTAGKPGTSTTCRT